VGVFEPRPGTRMPASYETTTDSTRFDSGRRGGRPRAVSSYLLYCFLAKPAGRCTSDLTTMIDVEQWLGSCDLRRASPPAVAADLGSDLMLTLATHLRTNTDIVPLLITNYDGRKYIKNKTNMQNIQVRQ
jgi:hypothetical protein